MQKIVRFRKKKRNAGSFGRPARAAKGGLRTGDPDQSRREDLVMKRRIAPEQTPVTPGRPTVRVADLDEVYTGRLVLKGYVERNADGTYGVVVSKNLTEGERRLMLARADVMAKTDALRGSGSRCHAFFDRDARESTKSIDETAARLLMPGRDVRNAYRRLVIPLSASVAKSLGLPLPIVQTRLRQLGILQTCIDAPWGRF